MRPAGRRYFYAKARRTSGCTRAGAADVVALIQVVCAGRVNLAFDGNSNKFAIQWKKESDVVYFSDAPRFELLDDGTIYSMAGTQRNCAGMAGIHVLITETSTGTLTFGPEPDTTVIGERPGRAVVGSQLAEELRDATFRGVRGAIEGTSLTIGVHFEILDALVHEVDARASKFREAGWGAMKGWLDLRYPGAWQPSPDDDTPPSLSNSLHAP